MTTEQAPGIPWHDHEWTDITTLGESQRHYVCTFDARGHDDVIPGSRTQCPAEKWEPIPEPMFDGFRVYDADGEFRRYATGGSIRLPGSIATLDDRQPDDYRVAYVRNGEVVAVGYVEPEPTVTVTPWV